MPLPSAGNQPVLVTGFEGGMLPSTPSDGNITLSTANPRTGTYHLRVDAQSGVKSTISITEQEDNNATQLFFRGYMYINTMPSVGRVILSTSSTIGTTQPAIYLRSDGKLQMSSVATGQGNATIYGTSTTALTTGVWNYIELGIERANDIAAVRINGVLEIPWVAIGAATAAPNITLGAIDTLASAFNVDWDDIRMDFAGWPGPGKVYAVPVSAAGSLTDNTNFTLGGSGAASKVQALTQANTTSYVTASGVGNTETYTMDTSALTGNGYVRGVCFWAYARAVTTASSLRVGANFPRTGGTALTLTNATGRTLPAGSPGTWTLCAVTTQGSLAASPNHTPLGGTWTLERLRRCEMQLLGSSANAINVAQFYAEVDMDNTTGAGETPNRLWAESFEAQSTGEYTTTNPTRLGTSTSFARTGDASLRIFPDASPASIVSATFAAGTEYYLQTWVYVVTRPSTFAQILGWSVSSSNCGLEITSTGAIQARGNIGLIGSPSTPNMIPLNTWTLIEYRLLMGTTASSTDAEVEIRVNRMQTHLLTGVVCRPTTMGLRLGSIAVGIGNGMDVYYDDVVLDGSSFPGGTRVMNIYPAGLGTPTGTGFAVTGAATQWQAMTEIPYDDGTSYVSTGTSTTADQAYTLSTSVPVGCEARQVAVITRMARAGASNGSVLPGTYRYGYASTNNTVATTATTYSWNRKNQNSSSAYVGMWTRELLLDTQLSLGNRSANTSRVTNMAMIVEYEETFPTLVQKDLTTSSLIYAPDSALEITSTGMVAPQDVMIGTSNPGFLTGFEGGHTGINAPSNGNITVQSTIKRSGDYALKVVGQSGVASNLVFSFQDGSPAYSHFSLYFYVATLPSVARQILTVGTSSATTSFPAMWLFPDGHISLTTSSVGGTTAVIATGTTLLTTGEWHRLDIAFNTLTPTQRITVKLDGYVEIRNASLVAGANVTGLTLGGFDTVAASYEMYWDDLFFDYSGFCPYYKIQKVNVNGAGTLIPGSNTPTGAATNWEALASIDDATSYITTSANAARESFTLEQLSSEKIVRAVGVWWKGRAVTSNVTIRAGFYLGERSREGNSGKTFSSTTTFAWAHTTIGTYLNQNANNSSAITPLGGNFTPSRLAATELTLLTTSVTPAQITALYAEVAYDDRVGARITPSRQMIEGFESSLNSAIYTTSSDVAISTVQTHSGTRSLRINPAGNTAAYISAVDPIIDSELFMRVWVYVTRMPTVSFALMSLGRSVMFGAIRLFANGSLQLEDSSGVIGSASSAGTISLNTWTRVELRVRLTASTVGQLEMRVNDVSLASLTSALVPTVASQGYPTLGGNTTPGSGGVDIFYDDWVTDDTHWVGNTRLAYLTVTEVYKETGTVMTAIGAGTPVLALSELVSDDDTSYAVLSAGSTAVLRMSDLAENVAPAGLNVGAVIKRDAGTNATTRYGIAVSVTPLPTNLEAPTSVSVTATSAYVHNRVRFASAQQLGPFGRDNVGDTMFYLTSTTAATRVSSLYAILDYYFPTTLDLVADGLVTTSVTKDLVADGWVDVSGAATVTKELTADALVFAATQKDVTSDALVQQTVTQDVTTSSIVVRNRQSLLVTGNGVKTAYDQTGTFSVTAFGPERYTTGRFAGTQAFLVRESLAGDGANRYQWTPSSHQINVDRGSFAMWVQFNALSTPGLQTAFFMNSGGNNRLYFQRSAAGFPTVSVGSGNPLITGATPIIDGDWNLFTVTWDGTTAHFYVNGVEIGTGTSYTAFGLASTAYIGANGAVQQVNGGVGPFLFAQEVLSPTEVLRIYDDPSQWDVNEIFRIPAILVADALITQTITLETTADALVRQTVTLETSADALVQAGVTTDLTTDALVQASTARDLAVDALVQQTITYDVESDALVQQSTTTQVSADALVMAQTLAQVVSDALVQTTISLDLETDAVVSLIVALDLETDALLQAALIVQVDADALVQVTTATELETTALVQETVTTELETDALVQQRVLTDLETDGLVQVQTVVQVQGSALVLVTVQSEIDSDALVQITTTHEVTTSALIAGTTLLTVSADAILLGIPGTLGVRLRSLADLEMRGRALVNHVTPVVQSDIAARPRVIRGGSL